MSGITATGWLLHILAGGGLLLLVAWTWAAWMRQPVRRHARGRVGRGGVAAAGRPQLRPGLARGDDAGAFRAGRDRTPTLFNR